METEKKEFEFPRSATEEKGGFSRLLVEHLTSKVIQLTREPQASKKITGDKIDRGLITGKLGEAVAARPKGAQGVKLLKVSFVVVEDTPLPHLRSGDPSPTPNTRCNYPQG